MGKQIVLNIILFAAGTAVLSGISQIFVKYKRTENYYLSGLFFGIGVLVFQYAFLFISSSPHPAVFAYHLTFISLLAPFLYFDYYTMISSDHHYPKRPMLYFIPPVVLFIFDSLYFSAGWNRNIIASLYGGDITITVIIYKVFYCAAVAEVLVLLGFLIYKVMSALDKEYRSVMLTILIYNIITISLLSLLTAGFISGSLSVMMSAVLVAAVLIILVPVYGQRHPEFVQIIATEAAKRRYERSLLGGLDVESVLLSLKKLMEEEKLYREDTLTLKQVAERLGITTHQLSELINERMSMNFNSYINRYRVTEAERILHEDPDRSILSISYEIGFNSKSSFYEAFLKCTGKTPQKYRSDIGNS